MVDECANRAEEGQRKERRGYRSSSPRQIKAAWESLRLQTLQKATLTDQDFETLSLYAKAYDEKANRYFIKPELLQRLPLKMATLSSKTRNIFLKAARETTEPRYFEIMPIKGDASHAEKEAARVAADMAAILCTLFRARPEVLQRYTELQYGLFKEPRAEHWHADSFDPLDAYTWKGTPILMGRVNLAPEFKRPKGEELPADSGALYLMASTSLSREGQTVDGTLHRSAPVSGPTPSVFLRTMIP